jgi:hypothetical protein
MAARKSKKLACLAKEMLAAKDRGRAAYGKADELLDELLDDLKPGEVLDLGDGQTFELVDRFAEKNKVFTPTGCNRFEVKVTRR